MKIAPRQVASFFSKPPDTIQTVLLHGNDAGLRSARSQELALLYHENLDDIFSVTRISGSCIKNEPAKIADAAAEIPMFGKRLVIVKAAGGELLDACKFLIKNPVPDSMVIIDASDTNTKHALVKLFETSEKAAAVGCYHDNNNDIKVLAKSIFQKDNISISDNALNLICTRLGNDHGTTRSELEKLTLLAGPDGHLNHQMISDSLGDSALLAVDDIANAVASGLVPALSAALNKAWLEEINCVMIIRGCQTHFDRLRMIGHSIKEGQSPSQAVRNLRPTVHFKIHDALMQQANRWHPSYCMDFINRLQDIEINLKSATINHKTLTSQGLLGLCLRAGK